MIEFLTEFIKKYYIDPINLGTGYNFINSLTYALLFVGFSYLFYIFLNRSKISIDKKLAIAIVPFVVLGSFVRVLEDAQIFKTKFLVTPMIWIIFISGIFTLLVISRMIEKKFKIAYFKIMFSIGLLFLLFPIAILQFNNFHGILLVLLFMVPWIILSFLVKWNIGNKLASFAHIFDATVSAVAISSYGFFEEYPIPRFISSVNPALYILVKAVVVIGVLLLIDKTSKDKKFNNYMKLIIAILGLGPGLRNLIALLVLV
jgi:uncharacterized membrane protein